MQNPLLQHDKTVAFDAIKNEHIIPAIEQRISEASGVLDQICQQIETPDWKNTIAPWEAVNEQLEQSWSPVTHLNMVMDSDELRKIYTECIQKLTAFHSMAGQNRDFFEKATSVLVSSQNGTEKLDSIQLKLIEDMLLSFKLSGVDLPADERDSFRTRAMRLSELSTQFNDNVLDATGGWDLLVNDEKELAGIPESAVSLFAQQAKQKDKEGWLIKLEAPSFIPVLSYADDRSLREKLYLSFTTRASDQGPNAGKWDNSKIIDETLSLRHQQANALGMNNYSELSLATKMASQPDDVEKFLLEVNQFAKKAGVREIEELSQFAQQSGFEGSLQAWDIGYYSEKMKKQHLNFDAQSLRPYFQCDKVVEGLFRVTSKLFAVSFEKQDNTPVWHKDADFYHVIDAQGQHIAGFYLDIFAREHKQGGAWMDVCRSRHTSDEGSEVTPIAYLNCNFTPPVDGKPSLLTHDEVETLFHEFGHGLHHMLTKISIPGISGISGVEWDAVELPSQFLENWCWHRESLDLFARHQDTGETIPDDMYKAMHDSKKFGAGLMLVRQLEFSLFDLRLHRDYPKDDAKSWLADTLQKARDEVALITPPSSNRFAHAFGHIFGGGYQSGYYSYLWAEQLSADAFGRFEEEGIFNEQTGSDFRKEILEVGGSRPAMDSFVAFRGRKPEIEALLVSRGVK